MAENSSSMHTSVVSLHYLPTVLPAILVVFLLRNIVRRFRARSITQIPGPSPGPWLVGNLPEVLRPRHAAKAEFGWIREYGTCLRLKGAFGEDILWLSDPKAMQYILNTGGYNFPKAQQNIATGKLLAGNGILTMQGTQHTRHRKVLNPAFSYSALRDFLPMFRDGSQRAVAKLKDQIAQSGSSATVIDLPNWLGRITLDIMGEAGFEYKFGALDEEDNDLYRVYRTLFIDSFHKRSDLTIAFEALWGHLPESLTDVVQKIPTKQLLTLRHYMKVARRYAKDIVDTQTQSHAEGKQGKKDIMSILVRANLSEDPRTKLSDEELSGQLTTMMLAGHETTASTSTWILYELSRHPEIQRQIREEIKATRVQVELRGGSELTMADLDSMKYLLAVIKETLRYHPILTLISRIAGRDDLIPLATPLTTKTGEVLTGVPVSKGQRFMLSLAAYNRLESVWGSDADVWKPSRFLEGVEHNQKTGLGVVSNMATFSSGLRSCIGWRFAMVQLQEIVTNLVENFEFSPAPSNPEIIRGATYIMVPMIKGREEHAELPITITAVA